MVETLGDEFDFNIVTSDRDSLENEPYSDIKIDDWQQVGKANVFYASPDKQTFSGIKRICEKLSYDVLYLNSFFCSKLSIYVLVLRRLRLISAKKVVLAPRGEFSPGALGLKSFKKRMFIFLSKVTGLHKDIIWHASTEHEREDILRAVGSSIAQHIFIAPDIPQFVCQEAASTPPQAFGFGPLRVVFLSRISPKKNLDFALKAMRGLRCEVVFDIYGMVDDEKHWSRCRELMVELPANVKVEYRGVVPHDQVAEVLSSYDLFFLPTLGENYGHAIAEALSQGTPVLISDQTPWRYLTKQGAGWDLPLGDESAFVQVIESLARMDSGSYAKLRKTTAEYANIKLSNPEVVQSNRELFQVAAQKGRA